MIMSITMSIRKGAAVMSITTECAYSH